MDMYIKRTNSELIEILYQQSLLTFESQISLREEIKKRDIQVDLSPLEASISSKLTQIKNLEYLKDFGFKADKNSDGITVTRTNKALFTDVIAIILGVIVFLIGIYGCINLAFTFINGDELDVFTLAYKFAIAGCIFIGIGFFSGLKRVFDYSGFELTNFNGLITLKKRFDLKLEEIKANASELFVETDEDTLFLKLGNQTIFTSNADNLVQTLTLKELAKKLKGA
ncbi:hypothetical protein SAMN04488008_102132 [Maribacter orientalis]|uniref:Uncharacterized protein n=1 Tax=Maribacter orientalis TaxID=228957 RepID=A0A1H7JS50_9FLAO|nr:hypothetical protein [Maribacter orientalis]SEK77224.1 hypothetical protein SAMN04488008_102132 [Maribacter orientalis]